MAEPTTQWVDAPAPAAQPIEPLENRVARLEGAVAALQDTRALEERVAQRVSERLQGTVTSEAQRLAAAEQRSSASTMMAAAEKVNLPVSLTA